jgi:hypothetical protein
MASPDEEFQEDEPRQSRRRPRPEDEDEIQDEPRPRRRRPDSDEEDEFDYQRPRRVRIQRSWLDAQFADTSMVLLVLFPFCCGPFALIFGIVGVAGCTEDKARRNAIIALVISVLMSMLHGIGFLHGMMESR